MFTVKARYYADPDNFGESYVLTSDNSELDTKLEIGQKVQIVPEITMQAEAAVGELLRGMTMPEICKAYPEEVAKVFEKMAKNKDPECP